LAFGPAAVDGDRDNRRAVRPGDQAESERGRAGLPDVERALRPTTNERGIDDVTPLGPPGKAVCHPREVLADRRVDGEVCRRVAGQALAGECHLDESLWGRVAGDRDPLVPVKVDRGRVDLLDGRRGLALAAQCRPVVECRHPQSEECHREDDREGVPYHTPGGRAIELESAVDPPRHQRRIRGRVTPTVGPEYGLVSL